MVKIDNSSDLKQTDYFKLNANDNNTFTTRSNDIFSSLGEVEQQYERHLSQSDSEPRSRYIKTDPVVPDEEIIPQKGFRSNTGRGFKRPNNRVRAPKFHHDPSKWKKYSLADVSDISDASNKQVAFNFLKELKNKSYDQSEDDDGSIRPIASDTESKIVFKKPRQIIDNADGTASSETTKDSSSKFVMPEYVIGQKITKSKPKSVIRKPDSDSHNATHGNAIDFLDVDAEQNDRPEVDDPKSSESFRNSGKKQKRCLRRRTEDEDDF